MFFNLDEFFHPLGIKFILNLLFTDEQIDNPRVKNGFKYIFILFIASIPFKFTIANGNYFNSSFWLILPITVVVEGIVHAGTGNPTVVFDPTLFEPGDGTDPLGIKGIVAGTWQDWE